MESQRQQAIPLGCVVPRGGVRCSASFFLTEIVILMILHAMVREEKSRLSGDWQFGLALLAGPAIWLGMYLFFQPHISLWWLNDPLKLMMVAIVWPVLEEIVFRGGLQGWLIDKPWGSPSIAGISRANVMTSLLFTSLHFINHPPLMATAVFAPSLLFGHFRDRYSGWLIPPITLHCFYNAGYFMLLGS